MVLMQTAGDVYDRKRACTIYIGFLGPSGSGKSSLINSLLGENILPRSDESASTGVAVEVSYNFDDRPERRYWGEIEGIDKEELANELRQLFEDKKAWDQGPDGDGSSHQLDIRQGQMSFAAAQEY